MEHLPREETCGRIEAAVQGVSLNERLRILSNPPDSGILSKKENYDIIFYKQIQQVERKAWFSNGKSTAKPDK